MKCLVCGSEFEANESELEFEDICDQCAETRSELTNGKGET